MKEEHSLFVEPGMMYQCPLWMWLPLFWSVLKHRNPQKHRQGVTSNRGHFSGESGSKWWGGTGQLGAKVQGSLERKGCDQQKPSPTCGTVEQIIWNQKLKNTTQKMFAQSMTPNSDSYHLFAKIEEPVDVHCHLQLSKNTCCFMLFFFWGGEGGTVCGVRHNHLVIWESQPPKIFSR